MGYLKSGMMFDEFLEGNWKHVCLYTMSRKVLDYHICLGSFKLRCSRLSYKKGGYALED